MNPDPQTLECMKRLDKFNETGCTKEKEENGITYKCKCGCKPKILIKSNVEQYLEWCGR
jgi:hypothetical protein